MPVLQHQVVMPYLTGDPADVAVNTWHTVTDDVGAHLAAIKSAITNFYINVWPGQTFAIGVRISDVVSRLAGSATIRTYQVPAFPGNMGPPIDIDDFGPLPAAAGTGSLPSEMALVTSFHGTLTGTILDRRKRGRVYIGPLGVDQVTDLQPHPVRPLQIFTDDLVIATEALVGELNGIAGGGTNLVVFSRAGWSSDNVVGGWVDNAFDVQRRRGEAPLTRYNWP